MSIITSAVGMGMKVLAIAETNIAVDNMTRRLARIGVAVLRLGRVEKVDDDMVEHTLEGQLKTQAEQESRKVKFTDQRTGRSIPKKADLARVLKRADVVLTTCAGAGDPMLRFYLIEFFSAIEIWFYRDRTFPLLLVDEATQVWNMVNAAAPIKC